MSELNQLKERIDLSGSEGVLTEYIRDDYAPAGQMMINQLTASGEYVQRRVPMHAPDSRWRIFNVVNAPY